MVFVLSSSAMKTTTTHKPRRVVCFSSPGRFEEAKEAPIPPARSKNAPLYYNCTLEKGTHVEHSGDVIVVGNVEKDASITTENGDIVVFGSLRGEAIVRRRNKRRSDDLDDDLEGGKIFALDMRPEVLEIDETQMPPPEHLLDTGVNVKDKRAMTGIPMVAEKSERTGEITFSKFYGGASNDDDDDAERYYEWKEKNSLSAEQLERCKRAAMVTWTYILAVGVCLFPFPRRLFHAVVPIGETLSSAVWLRVVACAAIAFGLYYRAVAENGETGFYKATVTGRYFVGTSLLFLALFSQHANLALFAVGLVNFLGAFAMKKSLEFGKRTKTTTTTTTRNDKNKNKNNNSWANPSI